MELRDANYEMLALLYKWDPLGYGEDAYETEVFDVIEAVHRLDDVGKLALNIQSIYEFSFEERIPLTDCANMAQQLFHIKNRISCDLP
ncbi:DUF1871 family protein [Bacillus kexueae]|uniref:DUF1871 family protein n=1 Tax=Aeribacillus kexueae TaxID=2078952 RepID=UPI001FAF2012